MPLCIFTSAKICPSAVNSTPQVCMVFSINYTIWSGILYILRQCCIQLWGTMSWDFLVSIQAITRFFRLFSFPLRICWSLYSSSSVPLVLLRHYYYYYYYYSLIWYFVTSFSVFCLRNLENKYSFELLILIYIYIYIQRERERERERERVDKLKNLSISDKMSSNLGM